MSLSSKFSVQHIPVFSKNRSTKAGIIKLGLFYYLNMILCPVLNFSSYLKKKLNVGKMAFNKNFEINFSLLWMEKR